MKPEQMAFSLTLQFPDEVLTEIAQKFALRHIEHVKTCAACTDAEAQAKAAHGQAVMAALQIRIVQDENGNAQVESNHVGPDDLVSAMLLHILINYREPLGQSLHDMALTDDAETVPQGATRH